MNDVAFQISINNKIENESLTNGISERRSDFKVKHAFKTNLIRSYCLETVKFEMLKLQYTIYEFK